MSQKHRRGWLARSALEGIAAPAIALLLAIASGCAVSREPRPPMPAAAATGPPATTDRPPAPPAPGARVQQAAYLSAEGMAIPGPSAAPAANPQAPSVTVTAPSGKPEFHVRSLSVEELPAPAPGSALTLDEAIAETLKSDPKLQSAMESIRQAEGDFTTSALLPNPTVQLNGIFLPLRPFTQARPGGPPELDVIATYPIDWWLFGKRAAAMATAQLGVAVSNADYCDQVRQRMASTASAFYDVLEAKAMLRLAQEDLASLNRVEEITRAGVRLGGSGTIEAERIRLSVLDAQREVRTREATLKTSTAQFRSAIGRGMCAPACDAAGNLDVPSPATPLSVCEAATLAEQSRPDITSLRRQIAKARCAIEVERTKARPTLSPSLGYTPQFQECNGVPDAPSFTAQMNISVPLFDRNQGNISKAESLLAQSCFNLQAQLVQTEADIEQAVAEFQAARSNVISLGTEQLQAARSVRDRTEAAFRLGGKTLLEVIDAERAYRDTYRTHILSQSGYWHALYKLNAAVGQQVLQ
jgi:cobalt-zinc-cadmium efflux system outer membrane protein